MGLGYVPYPSLQNQLRQGRHKSIFVVRRITPQVGCSYKNFNKARKPEKASKQRHQRKRDEKGKIA